MEGTDFSYVGIWHKFERAPCYRVRYVDTHGQHTSTEILSLAT